MSKYQPATVVQDRTRTVEAKVSTRAKRAAHRTPVVRPLNTKALEAELHAAHQRSTDFGLAPIAAYLVVAR
jgi:hypothetical protein